ncbi:Hpt domain-containing protein [Clostridium saccharobutylicum]|uniref:Chemotaxis protein histidine kinase n=2 Tax=Clostridium saccharobutylicum TaxID=169679 RepID=U5MTQ1_CLOSA|nr:Hpt domain-containing protein [Clostridium saccharobutylicum]AGX43036.1 chemotaxis protein histidine kinase [Clostridium saccharobutylicum DSM 13864]AQR90327.1 chemotaxis protein CheA [Clostridium saccharobutylicum]AQS00233.1 chemotaxis protein CheA [Clostridium saccharobutylicum]AQS14216.1 chemotaxis protein CheA [Clostridium saccharobutylicum]MBA2905351.1 two-component system chemotaxis sensor kinase CheA [Clostridium saccharobutylicum]
MNQNELLEVYFEETCENLDEAERCMIGLEKSFCMEELNSLFRCIHTIKGSSAAVDFNEISSLAHKLEDILNHVRDGDLEFNSDNSNLCISSIDKLLELFNFRRQYRNDDIDYDIIKNTLDIEERMDQLISSVSEDTGDIEDKQPIIITNSQKEDNYNEKFYQTYFVHILFDVEDMMQSITSFMIINSMNENGKICYSYPEVDFMISMQINEPVSHYECLFKTNLDSEQLFNKLDIPFIKKIKIIDVTNAISSREELTDYTEKVCILFALLNNFLSIGKYYNNVSFSKKAKKDINNLYENCEKILESNEFSEEIVMLIKELKSFLDIPIYMIDNNSCKELFNSTNSLYECLIYKIYNTFKNKIIFKYVELKLDKQNIERLDNISSKLNKKIFKYVLLDVSEVEILESDEIKKLIKVNNSLEEEGIELVIINGGKYKKRLYNIFEAIGDFDNIRQCNSEINAVLLIKNNKERYEEL